jgi:uncharacterized protein (TIGR02284 family)
MNTAETNKDVISELNDLIETCKDGQEGFRVAAEAVERPDLRTLFNMYAQQRAAFAAELNNEVLRLGGDPAKSGHASATLHRGWMHIKEAVTGKSEPAIIDECERGEDAAMEAYQNALKKNLPAPLMELVQSQFESVRQAHESVRNLKHVMHAR